MDRVRNEEVSMRAGIERELASRADQRVLRWFGHVDRMDEYHMARRVLKLEVSGMSVWVRPRLGWMDGLQVAWQQRNVGGGYARMHERSERVESPSTYVTEWVSRGHFLFDPVFFRTALPCSGYYHLKRGWMPLHDGVGINCKKGTTFWKSRRRCQIYGLRGECWWLCELSDSTWLPLLSGGRKSGILL